MQGAASHRLLISDANILIDISVGNLLSEMFQLEYDFGVPDVLFVEELLAQHPELPGIGLKILSLESAAVSDMVTLQAKHHKAGVSINDCMALALARQEACTLLTGDSALRQVALAEGEDDKGTVWLMEQMLGAKLVDGDRARQAYQAMKEDGSRLPWEKVDQQLKRYRLG